MCGEKGSKESAVPLKNVRSCTLSAKRREKKRIVGDVIALGRAPQSTVVQEKGKGGVIEPPEDTF